MLYSRLKMGRKAIIMIENVILSKNPLYIYISLSLSLSLSGVTEKRESACVVPKAEMLFIKSFPY